MAPRETVEARPRRTVEILDDAWRIALAEPVLLLSLTALFQLPAFASFLWLLCEPVPQSGLWRLVLPAFAALLLMTTGLAAGACQEAFHSWAEGYPVRFGECILSALQRGLHHIGSQAITLLPLVLLLLSAAAMVELRNPAMFSLLLILIPSWVIAMLFGLSRQPAFAAGQQRFWRGVRYSLRATTQHFGRACLVLLVRGFLMFVAILNLHLFWNFVLWTAENLGGIDVALLGVLSTLVNPVYLFTLIALAWWLLTPFNEAVNYLFFIDARTRYEGLDLWHRVEELFPVRQSAKAGAVVAALCLGMMAGTVHADELLPAVQAARQEVAAVRTEVEAAKPYPGGQRWVGRLKSSAVRLEKSSPQEEGFRWFRDAIAGFADREQNEAVRLLKDLDTQLSLVEESLTRPRREAAQQEPDKDFIKSLVPPDNRKRGPRKVAPKEPPPKDDIPNDNTGPPVSGPKIGGGPAVLPAGAGLGAVAMPLLILLMGIVVAVVLAGVAFAVYKWWQNREKTKPPPQGTLATSDADFLEDPDKQDVRQLWTEADARARDGDYLGAVRTLYLAVLAMLHQARLIRYERTRTNGEYADQLRRRGPIHRPFLGLTGLFEVKWYGERACQPQDYKTCRELAEELRVESSKPLAA
jgi:hypothetical protein